MHVPSWIKSMKKAELHAHLSGSIRAETLHKLLNKSGNEEICNRAQGLVGVGSTRTLKPCFELFPIIHDLIQDTSTLHEVTTEVLKDFNNDNVVYLELRTTPRASQYMNEEQYLRTVLKAIQAFHEQSSRGSDNDDDGDGCRLVCRVLVSLSRHLPVSHAHAVIAILDKLWNKDDEDMPLARQLIVGVELSGDPRRGNWKDFEPLFQSVRSRLKLCVSLHFAEIRNDSECMQMLDFAPERFGHAVVMSPKVSERLLSTKRDDGSRIGVEVCLTSNLSTKAVNSLKFHPVVTTLIARGHPFCICTDDSGVFDTSVSQEYALLVEAAYVTEKQVKDFAKVGLDLAFCRERDVMEMIKSNM